MCISVLGLSLRPCEFSLQHKLVILLREFEWEQVSPGLQNSSEYLSGFQQFCVVDGFDSYTDFS